MAGVPYDNCFPLPKEYRKDRMKGLWAEEIDIAYGRNVLALNRHECLRLGMEVLLGCVSGYLRSRLAFECLLLLYRHSRMHA